MVLDVIFVVIQVFVVLSGLLLFFGGDSWFMVVLCGFCRFFVYFLVVLCGSCVFWYFLVVLIGFLL